MKPTEWSIPDTCSVVGLLLALYPAMANLGNHAASMELWLPPARILNPFLGVVLFLTFLIILTWANKAVVSLLPWDEMLGPMIGILLQISFVLVSTWCTITVTEGFYLLVFNLPPKWVLLWDSAWFAVICFGTKVMLRHQNELLRATGEADYDAPTVVPVFVFAFLLMQGAALWLGYPFV